jgi:hypothetical protein
MDLFELNKEKQIKNYKKIPGIGIFTKTFNNI